MIPTIVLSRGGMGGGFARGISGARSAGRGGGFHTSGRFLGGGYSSRHLGGSSYPYVIMTSSQRHTALRTCVKEKIAEERNVTLMLHNARNLTESEAETSCEKEQRDQRNNEILFLVLFLSLLSLLFLHDPVMRLVEKYDAYRAERRRNKQDQVAAQQVDKWKKVTAFKQIPAVEEDLKMGSIKSAGPKSTPMCKE
ncbi:unnamed protein product [Bursaphelenchus okinawaensis]|uniref:Uncharacterized protein n=1 Tax=Bursaphelenchus okinawaensis TaxID=465554 RepID=A0A811L9N9_9BILA|nr:unnamed protein product [Bursaphelenchus okinawaensis]CAG9119342.1 unnamed protein product [Bursaphelenchus okinawaensis]